MKRIICLIIAFVLVVIGVSACSRNDQPTGQSTEQLSEQTCASTTTDDSQPVDTTPVADIPVIKYDGRSFDVYGETDMLQTFFFAEEPGTDNVQGAKYRMITNIEERYGIDITIMDARIVGIPYVTTFEGMVDGGDCPYHLVEMHDVLGTGAALSGYCTNLKDVKYLEFDKPWWHNINELAVNDSVYMIATDMSFLDIAQTWCLYFNKTLMSDMNIEYPYQSVLDGTWTIDELIRLTKDVYADKNKNNVVDQGDIYGISVGYSMYGWMDSFGIPMVQKDDSGRLVVTDRVDEVAAAIDKVVTWLTSNVGATTSGLENTYDRSGFEDGQYLFFQNNMRYAADALRNLQNFDYGILPMPKYSETKEYISTTMSYPFWIPANYSSEELEYIGLIVEALSYEGYQLLTPAYFDVALKNKFVPSEIDAQVITIINDCRHPDISRYYDNGGSGMYNILYELHKKGSADVMSYFDSKKGPTQELLDWYNTAYGLD